MAEGFDREYPRGRIAADDEGSTAVAIALDAKTNTLILRYAKPMDWVGMGPDEVEQMLYLFAKHLSTMRGVPVTVQIGETDTEGEG